MRFGIRIWWGLNRYDWEWEWTYSVKQTFLNFNFTRISGNFVKMQILRQEAFGGAWGFAFLTSSQGLLMLLDRGTHFAHVRTLFFPKWTIIHPLKSRWPFLTHPHMLEKQPSSLLGIQHHISVIPMWRYNYQFISSHPKKPRESCTQEPWVFHGGITSDNTWHPDVQ